MQFQIKSNLLVSVANGPKHAGTQLTTLSSSCSSFNVYSISAANYLLVQNVIFNKGNDATSIPAECCAYPYIVNGSLYYNCSVNAAFSSDFGCYNNKGQWVTCQQPEGTYVSLMLVNTSLSFQSKLFERWHCRYFANVVCCFLKVFYGRPLSVSGRPCYILPMFYLFFFMATLFSGPGERRLAKVLHVVDLECH